ncbi:MAG TPA: hypothetical protein VJT75_18705 [Thermoleophilaceae bacterium]|nr:hypothetical protein [Thermoleophilaceae bacterium]
MAIFNRSRKGGRRREDEGVEAIAFELEVVEFVQASDELGLLRVVGRWLAPVDVPLGDIVLNASRGSETLELQRLPDLGGVAPLASPQGVEWKGAFTVPVDVALDPRLELVLVAGEDAAVALPRPGETVEPEPEPSPEPELHEESPIVADLVARLDQVAHLEDEEPADADEETHRWPADAAPDPGAQELDDLRAELALRTSELEEVRAELTSERHRREVLEQELRDRDSVEDDLRNAMAMQEAQLASAVAEASQRVRQEQRRRDLTPANGAGVENRGTQPADEAFLTRLERARRASETAPS